MGMFRFPAKRLAVPAGRIASTALVSASASMHSWTVPSPPQMNITSAPFSNALRAHLAALLLVFISYQSGSG